MRGFVLETSHSYGHLHHVSLSLMQGLFQRLPELESLCAFRVRVEGGSSHGGCWYLDSFCARMV